MSGTTETEEQAEIKRGVDQAIADQRAHGRAVTSSMAALAHTAAQIDHHGRVIRATKVETPEKSADRPGYFRAVRGTRKERWRKLMEGGK